MAITKTTAVQRVEVYPVAATTDTDGNAGVTEATNRVQAVLDVTFTDDSDSSTSVSTVIHNWVKGDTVPGTEQKLVRDIFTLVTS
jgi:hypothetical protein